MIKCDFCGKEFKTQSGVYAHYKYCKERCRILGKDFTYIPFQKKDGSFPGRGWNKGLTCETDERVNNGRLNRKASFEQGKWIPHNLNKRTNKIIIDMGYRCIYFPEHPLARSNGLVFEHTLVAENMIGRHLHTTEVVHHKDENRSNNDPNNLMVFKTKGDHSRFHNSKNFKLVVDEEGVYSCESK